MLQETANSVPSVLVILFLKKSLGFAYTDKKVVEMQLDSCLFRFEFKPPFWCIQYMCCTVQNSLSLIEYA